MISAGKPSTPGADYDNIGHGALVHHLKVSDAIYKRRSQAGRIKWLPPYHRAGDLRLLDWRRRLVVCSGIVSDVLALHPRGRGIVRYGYRRHDGR
jgi:hypothetical protein